VWPGAGADPTPPPAVPSEPTVNDLITRYASEHLARNLRSGANVEKLLRLHVQPSWGERQLTTLPRSDLLALLEAIRMPRQVFVQQNGRTVMLTRGGRGAAAEVRKWVRAMFQFGVDAELLRVNPFTDVKNRDRPRRRDRVLLMQELRAVWDVAGAMGYPWGPCFRLILLTGDRRGEWASAQWDWLDAHRTRLEIPATVYKTGRPQVIPLSRQAQVIVHSLPQNGIRPYLFSTTAGCAPCLALAKRSLVLIGFSAVTCRSLLPRG